MEYTGNPLTIIGVVLCMIGLLIFLVGKKWFIFRWFLNDRSMFSQIAYGSIIFLVELVLLFVSGSFSH